MCWSVHLKRQHARASSISGRAFVDVSIGIFVNIERMLHTHAAFVLSPVAVLQSTSASARFTCCMKRPRSRAACIATLTSQVEECISSDTLSESDADGDMRNAVTNLASHPGAMGRGVRACLRALYRRAAFVVEAARTARIQCPHLYVECGPAYVLAAATISPEKVTRYAVEQRAWPALKRVLEWEEVPVHEAKARGARLRGLNEGGRYGRHLFFTKEALTVAMQVAEDIFEDVRDDDRDIVGEVHPPDAWVGADVEAVVHLRRMPLPGIRTVSARCPRGAVHSNGDRTPSLMLWMNNDGISGGAMCPVCLEDETPRGTNTKSAPPTRFLTWRVMYMPDNRAVLCTPRRRSHQSLANMYANRHRTADSASESADADTSSAEGESHDSSRDPAGDDYPVGGCVLEDAQEATRVGEVQHMAYVTATLKMASDPSCVGDVSFDGARLRTVGTMARQKCPMKVLMWSERRSKGPMAAKRVEEVAWFARQSVADDDDQGHTDAGPHHHTTSHPEHAEGGTLRGDDWLPTSIVSVSAMRPTSWRDVASSSGRVVSVPAGWEASAQAWILFDFDDVENLNEDVVAKAARKIVSAVRREQELSGRCMVVLTGPAGLHVWVELREVRERPKHWFSQDVTRTWYANLGARLLAAAHRAGAARGKVDLASCAAGRFARRPGWRILADGNVFRSRIVTIAASRVRKRGPRIVR